jgi:2-succinyl-6-hydroxy-2,4-cyclohexadiene-1-carboxylate synthase
MTTQTQVYFLHGFLGAPGDWNEVVSYLPYRWKCEAVDLARQVPSSFPEDATVVGYSLGGRIAMRANHAGGLCLLGAHLGLASEEEKKKRAEEEAGILRDMQGSPDAFLKKWYSQPLFKTLCLKEDLFKRRRSIDFAKHAELFERFSLSRQPLFEPPAHALLLYGENDEKYAKLYCHFPNAKAVPQAGHAMHIENPKAVASLIQQYVENFYGN